LLFFYARHEQRLLLDTLWADFLTAVPASYLAVGGLVAVLASISTVGRRPIGARGTLACFALVGWGIGSFLTGSVVGLSQVAISTAALLTGLPVAYSLPRLTRATLRGERA
jgi:predicted permease